MDGEKQFNFKKFSIRVSKVITGYEKEKKCTVKCKCQPARCVGFANNIFSMFLFLDFCEC